MLRVGSRGDDVRALQEWLAANGYDPGAIDGIFGPRTQAAVLSFQRAAGIAADGVVGPQTTAAMQATEAGGGPEGGPTAIGAHDTEATGGPAPDYSGIDYDSHEIGTGTADGGDPSDRPIGEADPIEPAETGRTLAEVRQLFDYMPGPVLTKFIDYYIDHNEDPDIAVAYLRDDPVYERYFPGNKRKDGSVRMGEVEYMATIDAYENSLLARGVSPRNMRDRFADLIAGDVSADEFEQRVSTIYNRVLSQEHWVKDTYRRFYGVDFTREALVASMLDPKIGDDVLNKRISMAELGGEAELAGFQIKKQMANRLFQSEMSREQASQLFQAAAYQMPGLRNASIAANERQFFRESFQLGDFIQAYGLTNPQTNYALRRIDRLRASATAAFSESGGRANEWGQVGGILQR